MRFRVLVLTLAWVLLAAPLAAEAQAAQGVYRIGILRGDGPVSTWRRAYQALLQGLRDLGYVEGG
jgi:hypothetical protein